MNVLSRLAAPLGVALALVSPLGAQPGSAPAFKLQYSFGPKPVPGFTQVRPGDAYNPSRTYGFDLGSKVAVVERAGGASLAGGFTVGENGRPFFFSTRLGEGAYRVDVTLGDSERETVATVKSETRRLMLEEVRVPAGERRRHSFFVHLRQPRLPDGQLVALKPREREPILYVQWDEKDDSTRLPIVELDWDEKLTLAFSDAHPALCTIEIAPAEKPITVFLIGDSTVTDQMMEPFAAWGQMLPRWFKAPVLVANYAQSGETTASFVGERRWPKVLSELQAGDYVLMQFGINDQRLSVDEFKKYFVQFIQDTRARGAVPVLVTSQNLRRLDPAGKAVQTLRDHPAAMRDVAREHNAALVDLNRMSMAFYEALGPDNLARAFVDGTHQSNYGAYQLAKAVVQGIVAARLPLAAHLVDDWKAYDPAKPDPADAFRMPRDPQLDPARPGGPGAPDGRGPMAGDPPRGGPAAKKK